MRRLISKLPPNHLRRLAAGAVLGLAAGSGIGAYNAGLPLLYYPAKYGGAEKTARLSAIKWRLYADTIKERGFEDTMDEIGQSMFRKDGPVAVYWGVHALRRHASPATTAAWAEEEVGAGVEARVATEATIPDSKRYFLHIMNAWYNNTDTHEHLVQELRAFALMQQAHSQNSWELVRWKSAPLTQAEACFKGGLLVAAAAQCWRVPFLAAAVIFAVLNHASAAMYVWGDAYGDVHTTMPAAEREELFKYLITKTPTVKDGMILSDKTRAIVARRHADSL